MKLSNNVLFETSKLKNKIHKNQVRAETYNLAFLSLEKRWWTVFLQKRVLNECMVCSCEVEMASGPSMLGVHSFRIPFWKEKKARKINILISFNHFFLGKCVRYCTVQTSTYCLMFSENSNIRFHKNFRLVYSKIYLTPPRGCKFLKKKSDLIYATRYLCAICKTNQM